MRGGIVEKNNERWCWNLLGAILGDFPPSEVTRPAVEKALLSADMVDYIRRDPLLAVAVIGVMASQASHVRSEVRARIEAQILTAAAKLNDAELEAKKNEMVSDLILAGLIGCTWWEPNGEARAAALAMLLEQLAEGDSSPVFLRSGPFVLGLCDALPVSQARQFWNVRDWGATEVVVVLLPSEVRVVCDPAAFCGHQPEARTMRLEASMGKRRRRSARGSSKRKRSGCSGRASAASVRSRRKWT